MKEEMVQLAGQTVKVVTVQTAVVGSGAAGLNAASRLFSFGRRDLTLVTEGMNCGTSRNTGSDKQTYYKMTLAGEEADSVQAMAETLFSGGCVDGEHAWRRRPVPSGAFCAWWSWASPSPTGLTANTWATAPTTTYAAGPPRRGRLPPSS